MNRKLTAAAFAIAAALALTGCTIDIGDTNSDDNSGMMNHQSDIAYSGADIMFAQMMIPHHQQAVDMGTLAETRALSPEVKKLAAEIKAEQAPEIVQMEAWLEDAKASHDMGHEMGMGGMLSDTEMEALKNANGAEFDRLYLEGMIEHHKGAIHMAQMVVDSNIAEVAKLGNAIIESQTKQIAYMESLLKK
jgi:uncharacterized protein (DUF305 family)